MFPDGRLGVKWKGMPLPFTVVDNDQRVPTCPLKGGKKHYAARRATNDHLVKQKGTSTTAWTGQGQ